MKKIANILFNDVNCFHDFKGSHELFNLVTEENELLTNIPTLYACFRRANQLFPNIDILNKSIDGNNYWTFNKEDKIVDYFNGLSDFKTNFISFYQNYYNYVVYNKLFNADIDLPAFLMNKNIYSVYKNKRSIYYYYDNEILGIDIHYLMYVDPKLHKTLMNLQFANCKSNIFDADNNIIDFFQKTLPEHKDIIEKYIGIWM